MSFKNLTEISAVNFHNMRDQLQELIYKRSDTAFSAGDSDRDLVTDAAKLRKRQELIRKEFIASLGGLPPMDTPLKPKVAGVVKEKGLRIEKIIFESRPKSYVTANMYIPDGIKTPTAAVLFLCGHAGEGKLYPVYQVVCRHLARAGLIVMAQDPIGQGERFSYYERSLKEATIDCCCDEHDYAGAQSLLLHGGIARYFLHDAMRGIDYLATRPEVDSSRIGVTGNSGGGTQTSMVMLGDPRIAAAAPGTFVMNRGTYMRAGGAQDAEQIWQGLTHKGIDHEDILLAMCPKPVCVLAVKQDFFPIEGTRSTVERCRRIWKVCGRGSDLELVEDDAPHAYTPVLARAAARFFSKCLLGKERRVDSDGINPAADPKKLLCTRTGQIRGDYTDARFVFEENQSLLASLEKERRTLRAASDDQHRKTAIGWLKGKIEFSRRPVDLNPRHLLTRREDELLVSLSFWWSQKSIINEGLLFKNFQHSGKRLPVTLAVWDGGTKSVHQHADWIRSVCDLGRAVFVLNATGMGGSTPNPITGGDLYERYGTFHKLTDDLLWLNDSLCAMRAYDVIRCGEFLRSCPGVDGSDIKVFAHGRYGVYAELAGAVDASLPEIELSDEMDGFAAWVRSRYYNLHDSRAIILPGVLGYFDLPDLRRWRKK